mmetsp:Transcript_4266/g.7552  ORF Transcript_4266/g.7552 Transcript_4266/m.7552 type:complete len:113 (+) Transcript_4266:369-707(+)
MLMIPPMIMLSTPTITSPTWTTMTRRSRGRGGGIHRGFRQYCPDADDEPLGETQSHLRRRHIMHNMDDEDEEAPLTLIILGSHLCCMQHWSSCKRLPSLNEEAVRRMRHPFL